MIRKCKIDDVSTIASLEQLCFRSPLTEEFLLQDVSKNPFSNYLVYEKDNKIVGYIGVWVTDTVEVLNFCVHSDYRKLGIASELLNEVIEIADTNNSDICLEVRKSNEVAISIYEKNDFKVAYVRKNYYENNEDALLMIRKCSK